MKKQTHSLNSVLAWSFSQVEDNRRQSYIFNFKSKEIFTHVQQLFLGFLKENGLMDRIANHS